jgi:L-idonate 5-dehydrogenase
MHSLYLKEPGRFEMVEHEAPVPGPGEVRVRTAKGGICGSDLHYYGHGGFGTVRMKAPMVLGHEISGRIDAIGPGVTSHAIGDAVAVNPSLPCGTCDYCQDGHPRQCRDMRFMGSAMRTPHVDGGFRELVVCSAGRAVHVGPGVGLEEAALCEPLAVCLHAVNRAPSLEGKRVLVSGMGPIGALCLLAARHAGAGEIAAADLAEAPLRAAAELDADIVYDVSREGALAGEEAGRGRFDVVFECSGHPASLQSAFAVTRPLGAVVQVGMMARAAPFDLTPLVTKELKLTGTFRFDREFDDAARLISERRIDVRPLITDVLPYGRAAEAFALAMDRCRSMKVLLDFAG